MKATIRVPTIQYGFIDLEVEGSMAEIVATHNALVASVKQKENDDEWGGM